jgi:hypothetical protein
MRTDFGWYVRWSYEYEAAVQLSSQRPATPQKTFDATARLPIGFPPLPSCRTEWQRRC